MGANKNVGTTTNPIALGATSEKGRMHRNTTAMAMAERTPPQINPPRTPATGRAWRRSDGKTRQPSKAKAVAITINTKMTNPGCGILVSLSIKLS
jgi:hypothetical protein